MNIFLRFAAALGLAAAVIIGPACVPAANAEAPSGDAKSSAQSVTIAVEGMTCASCSVAVRTALKKLDGVKDAKVSTADKRAVVEYEPAKVKPEQMVEAINKLGYRASLPPLKGS